MYQPDKFLPKVQINEETAPSVRILLTTKTAQSPAIDPWKRPNIYQTLPFKPTDRLSRIELYPGM